MAAIAHNARSDARVSPRLLFMAAVLVGVGMLGAALLFQYAGGLYPCRLCLFQRLPYGVVILLGLAGLAGAAPARHLATPLRGLGLAIALAFAVGGAVAAYHVGVEQGWWQGSPGCVGDTSATGIDDLRAAIMAAPVAFCDEVAWSLFGISMAGWNLLASIVFTAATLIAVARWPRGVGL